MTDFIKQQLATAMADRLQDLLYFRDEPYYCHSSVKEATIYEATITPGQQDEEGGLLTNVEDRRSELDVTKMSRALCHVFAARSALDSAIDGAEVGIIQAAFSRLLALLVLH
jgi:hypothetical protein